MALDLSLAPLLNAIGALLFVLVGAWILALSRGARRNVLLGLLAIAFGLAFTIQNLWFPDRSLASGWAMFSASMAASTLAVLLAREEIRGLPRRVRRAALVFAGVLLVNAAIAAAWVFVEFDARPDGTRSFTLAVLVHFAILPSSLVLLLAGGAARLRASPSASVHDRRATTCVALAFGLYTTFSNLQVGAIHSGLTGLDALWRDGPEIVLGLLTILAIAAFVPARDAPEPRVLRASFFTLVAAGLAGVAIALAMGDPSTRGFGVFGIIRTIGAFLLALAILRFDLLGRSLRPTAARRGVNAAGALATLFIVAQIAQNFLSDAYGVLIGGLIAGAFLFAASPIHRALERRAQVSVPVEGERLGVRHDPEAMADFRAAFTAAWRDGRITPEEEMALARLADRLGLPASVVTAIRHEAQRNAAEPKP